MEIWSIEQEKDREKEKVGRQASEAQREKGWQGFRATDEKPKETFFCGKNNINILCSGGDKMRNASGHQCKGENERLWKKVNGNTYDISSIKRVTKARFKRRISHVPNLTQELNACEVRRLNQLNSTV